MVIISVSSHGYNDIVSYQCFVIEVENSSQFLHYISSYDHIIAEVLVFWPEKYGNLKSILMLYLVL